jgi:hypothetical protein
VPLHCLHGCSPHQYLTVLKGMQKVRTWEGRRLQEARPYNGVQDHCVLTIGALPRSGKSYMGAATVHLYNQKLQAEGLGRRTRALIYTTQPTETGSMWADVFGIHAEFDTSAATAHAPAAAAAVFAAAAAAGGAGAGIESAFSPASWVIMSKQAYDSNKARAEATRTPADNSSRAASEAAQSEDADAATEGEAAADDEYPDDPDGGAAAPAAVVLDGDGQGLPAGAKVIDADSATKRSWPQQEGGGTPRPSMQQIIGDGFDIILFDEAHLGSASQLSKEAVQRLVAGPHTLLVLITATYIRPISADGYCVPLDHLLTWSLLDVGYARSGNLKALADVHGTEHMESALKLSGLATRDQVGHARGGGLSAECCWLVR